MPDSNLVSTKELQKTIKDLKAQVHFLQTVADINPDMVSVINLETNELEYSNDPTFVTQGFGSLINPSGKKTMKRRKAEVHSDDRAAAKAYFKAFLKMGDDEVQKLEYRATNDRGELHWYHVQGRVFKRNAKGIPTHVINIVHNITERKKVKREIEKSREFLQAILNSSLDRIYVMEAERDKTGEIIDFRILLINEAVIKKFASNITGKLWSEHFPGKKKGEIFELYKKVIETGKPVQFEKHYERNGVDSWIHLSVVKFQDGIMVTGKDIAEQKKAEQEIKEQAHFIRTVTDAVPAIIGVTRQPSGVLEFYNRDMAILLGFDPKEIAEMDPDDRLKLVHPDDVQNLKDYYSRFDDLNDEDDNHLEYRLKNNKNEWKWLDIRGRVFRRNATGTVTHALHIAHDITFRKKTEQEIKEQSHFINSVTEAVPELIGIYEIPSRKATYLNQDPLVMMGFPKEELLSMTQKEKASLMVHPDYQQVVDDFWAGLEHLEAGEIAVVEHRFQKKIPGEFWVQVKGAPFLIKDGKVVQVILITRDISLEKNASREIKEQAHFIKSVTDNSPAAIVITEHPSNKIIFNNRDTMTMLGFDIDEMTRMGHEGRMKLVHPHDLWMLKGYYTLFDHMSDEEENHVVYRIKNKTGDYMWLSVTGKVFKRDDRGKVIQTLHIAWNITEQKNTEQQIINLKNKMAQLATDKYQLILNSIEDGFAFCKMIRNEEGKAIDFSYLEFNRAFEKQRGVKVEDFEGKTVMQKNPNMDPWWLSAYQKVVDTNKPLHFERFFDSSWWDISVYPFKDDCFSILFRNITDRKQQKEQQAYLLKLSEALRSIADPIQISKTATYMIGEQLNVNRAFYAEFSADGKEYVIHDNYISHGFPKRVGKFPASIFSSMMHWFSSVETPIVINDVIETTMLTAAEKEAAIAANFLAIIGVPLIKEEKLVAQLCVHYDQPRKWTAHEILLLQETAERTWASVERAKAEDALRKIRNN